MSGRVDGSEEQEDMEEGETASGGDRDLEQAPENRPLATGESDVTNTGSKAQANSDGASSLLLTDVESVSEVTTRSRRQDRKSSSDLGPLTYLPKRSKVRRTQSMDPSGINVNMFSLPGSEAGDSQFSSNQFNMNYHVRPAKRKKNHSSIEIEENVDVFVETPDLEKCLTKLRLQRTVVIKGPTGQGKKTLANALCRVMEERYSTKTIIINSSQEWDIDEDIDKPQVVLINNMFGSYEGSYVEDWLKVFPRMESCIDKANCLFHIITCKTSILNEIWPKINRGIFLEKNIFEIETSFRQDDMKCMISKHAERARLSLSESEIESIASRADQIGFPKACNMFLKRDVDKKTLPEKFQIPTDILMGEVAALKKSCVKTYGLLLLLMFKNPRSTSLQYSTQEMSEEETNLLALAGIQGSTFPSLLDAARRYDDIYIKESTEDMTVDFRSLAVLYAVVRVFFKYNADFVLKHCKFALLQQMIRIDEATTPTTLSLKKDRFFLLADRFLNMVLANDDLMNVCLHPAFTSEEFTNAFFIKAEGHLKKLFRLKDPNKGQSWLYWSVWSEKGCLCIKTLEQMEKCGFREHVNSETGRLSNVEEAIIAACVSNNTCSLAALLKMCSYDSSKFNSSKYDTGLLPKPGENDNTCLVSCDSILEAACRYSTPEVLEILIQERTKMANQEDFTSLFKKCIENNMPDALELLLDQLTKGIWVKEELQQCLDKNIEWNNGQILPSLHYAIKMKLQKIACRLQDHGSKARTTCSQGLTAVQTAWETGNIEMFNRLVECGGEFDFQDSTGMKPLHAAFSQNKKRLFMKMLEREVDVNFEDSHYGWPIVHACLIGDLKMVKALLNHGCRIDVTDARRRTPLHLAMMQENVDLVSMLCARDIRSDIINEKDGSGSTALHLGCDTTNTYFPYVTEFLQSKPGLEITNSKGETPLHLAWKNSNIKLIQELTEHGAKHQIREPETGKTLLHFAVEIQDVQLLRTLRLHGTHVTSLDKSLQTPLHIACKMQDLEVVDELLNFDTYSEDLNTEDQNHLTPLHIACDKGNIILARILIDKGADINKGSESTPVHVSWNNGNQILFQELIKRGGNVDIQDFTNKSTPLHKTCRNGDQNMLNFLLDNKADLDVKDDKGQYPLHICCKSTNEKMVLRVISCGNINGQDIHGKIPLYRACEAGNASIVKILLSNGSESRMVKWEDYPVLAALKNDNFEIIFKILREHDFDINLLDDNGESLLFYACQKETDEVIQRLLTCGANPSHFRDHSKSPLMAVVKNQNANALALLLKYGDINKQDDKGDVLLHLMCEATCITSVKMLLVHKADVNAENGSWESPLHIICKKALLVNKFEVVNVLQLLKIILEAGVNVNKEFPDGTPPLHLLCKENRVDMATCLLQHSPKQVIKPDLKIIDTDGNMAMHVICMTYNCTDEKGTAMLKTVIEAGADINAKSAKGSAPLHILCQGSSVEMVQCLLDHNPDLEIIDLCGYTALHLVVLKLISAEESLHSNSKQILELLLKNGADVNALLPKGLSPMHLMVMSKTLQVHVSKVFLEHNPDLDKRDEDGRMPIQLACKLNNFSMVKVLLEKQDFDKADMSEKESMDLLEALLGRGIEQEKKESPKPKTTTFIAYNKNNVSAIQKLLKKVNMKSKKMLNLYDTCPSSEFKKVLMNAGAGTIWQRWWVSIVSFIFFLLLVLLVIFFRLTLCPDNQVISPNPIPPEFRLSEKHWFCKQVNF